MLRSPTGRLRLRVSAARLHMVAGAPGAARLRLRVDGGATRPVEVTRPKLHTLFDSTSYAEHTLELEAEVAGLSLYSATFG